MIWIIPLRHSELTMTQRVAGKEWIRKNLTTCRAVSSPLPLPLFAFNSFSMCSSLNNTENKQIMLMPTGKTAVAHFLPKWRYLPDKNIFIVWDCRLHKLPAQIYNTHFLRLWHTIHLSRHDSWFQTDYK